MVKVWDKLESTEDGPCEHFLQEDSPFPSCMMTFLPKTTQNLQTETFPFCYEAHQYFPLIIPHKDDGQCESVSLCPQSPAGQARWREAGLEATSFLPFEVGAGSSWFYKMLPLCARAPSEEELGHSGFITSDLNVFPHTPRPSDWSFLFLFLVDLKWENPWKIHLVARCFPRERVPTLCCSTVMKAIPW